MKKSHGNAIKDNVAVMSSNISQNDGTITMDFEDFQKLTYFANHEDDIQS